MHMGRNIKYPPVTKNSSQTSSCTNIFFLNKKYEMGTVCHSEGQVLWIEKWKYGAFYCRWWYFHERYSNMILSDNAEKSVTWRKLYFVKPWYQFLLVLVPAENRFLYFKGKWRFILWFTDLIYILSKHQKIR